MFVKATTVMEGHAYLQMNKEKTPHATVLQDLGETAAKKVHYF